MEEMEKHSNVSVLCSSELREQGERNDSQQNTNQPCFLTYDTERLSGKF